MKKALTLFLALFIGFIAAWVIKPKTPATRPDAYSRGLTGSGNWWISTVSAEEVDSVWKIDHEIDSNYIPVPGADELYMVIDENGRIIKYRHRTKQSDGSWRWEDVNPDIPDNYEPVDGLENVYKVTDKDGNVSYYKYIRNIDNDTFAFVLVDKDGNDIETVMPIGSEIPDNFKHMGENVYAVLNKNGVVIDYKERLLKNGNYVWRSVDKPAITEQDYNEWLQGAAGTATISQLTGGNTTIILQPEPLPTIPPDMYNQDPVQNPGQIGNGQVIEVDLDGHYTEQETIISKEQNGKYIISYQTTYIKVYDKYGELLETRQEGPIEVGREELGASNGVSLNKGDMAQSLNGEVTRITKGVSFNDSLANQVLSRLNAERASLGYSPLVMNSDSNVYKVAKCRAAVCALTNSSDYINPLYGDLAQHIAMFGISSDFPSECVWRTVSNKSADNICVRFLNEEGSRDAILSSQYSTVGIAIAEASGYIYIEIVFI